MNSTQQKDSFQSDIKALESWTRKWCIKFNVDKCSVLVFNPSQSSPHASYTLDGNPFQITQETKYLGVVIQFDLPTTFIPKLVKQNDSWVWLSVHYL